MTLNELAQEYLASRLTSILDEHAITGFFVEATTEYAGWAQLQSLVDSANPVIDGQCVITLSEWAVIKPLAYLLCEKETALMHELSKMMSHEPAGRSSSEIENDITNFRNEYFRQWAFNYPCASI
ncbi:hypothetical protein [Hydromonas duriensis]|uniref:Uncharacterized protein n=1 Tax=Hydromonas duriensis TaxID=1527608 RepID=A0A4R6Y509_9BURK|nr:hypothetical protein [Hydromonas duriensis]TDR30343.1 hypothetical protein DFR44_12212 [Hydromonas duriensis]